jgi:very-short-patch-repair endonuclease
MNRVRDAETTTLLEQQGWTVLRIWEHESLDSAVRAVAALVEQRRAALDLEKSQGGGFDITQQRSASPPTA